MNIFDLCLLLLNTPYLLIQKITCEDARLELAVESNRQAATCPACTQQSQALHSSYWRYPQDLPLGVLPVVLQLKVKRFFCQNAACPKRTFAERFPDLVGWYGRRTQRVIERQQQLTTSTTARTAERLLKAEHIRLSDTTINRLIRGLPDPERQPVRVLGVDDWAKRKGQRYGTILIDLEQSEVIDLLPDRTAETLAEWLEGHPGIEIVSRDRSQTYAEAIRSGAPNAIQVADRFHLLQNLSDTVFQLLQKEEKTIHQHFTGVPPQQDLPEPQQPDRTRPLTQAEKRRQERMAQAEQLRQSGWSQKEIARQLHLNPKTVHRYQDRSSPRVHRLRARSKLDPFKPYLLKRWNEGCHNAAQLYREIQPKGFCGHVTIVMGFIRELRKASGLPPKGQKTGTETVLSAEAIKSPPTLRTLTWWILKRPEDRAEEAETILTELSEEQSKLTETIELARGFADIVRQQQADQYGSWLEQASTSKAQIWQNFATGLKQDEAAIRAALHYSWSNGPTEGHVNRLKCLKRQMYGRAKDDLLRKRVFWQGKLTFT